MGQRCTRAFYPALTVRLMLIHLVAASEAVGRDPLSAAALNRGYPEPAVHSVHHESLHATHNYCYIDV